MIDKIIEDSYKKKIKIRKNIKIEEAEKSELFHKIKYENFKLSSLIYNKVKKANATINSNINNLLSYSTINSDNRFIREQLAKTRKIMASENFENNKTKNKFLFNGDLTLSNKLKKTKIKEFSFANKNKSGFLTTDNFTKIIFKKNQNSKNKTNHISKNNSLVYKYDPESSKFKILKKSENLKMSKDSLFITKLPQKNNHPEKEEIASNSLSTRKLLSKELKLRKMRNLIRESNSKMLDIYIGLKSIKENRTMSIDNISGYMNQPKSQSSSKDTIKLRTKRKLRNIDKFINLDLQKSQSIGSINRKFRTLFKNIFEKKKLSDDKLDPIIFIHPFDNLIKETFREIKMDNSTNNSVGQRIWIKKSTANMVSYGKSCEQISDDIFYKERKRIISIYPKIEEEAKVVVPKKKINKKNPLFKGLIENVNKLSDVFNDEYKLLKKINLRMRKHKII